MTRARVPKRPEPPRWEVLVLEAVGRVIEYWGFKRNHGRMWAFLYLTGRPADAASLGRKLGLSKGAVSMALRELETWGVVRRVPVPTRSGVGYAAEQDLWRMVTTVLRQRESRLVEQVWNDLRDAEVLAARDMTLEPGERRAVAARIRRMRRFAEVGRAALETFMRSFRLNLEPLVAVLNAARHA
jgi:DNA-binding transcriptional regulator GbsR (MarR family)